MGHSIMDPDDLGNGNKPDTPDFISLIGYGLLVVFLLPFLPIIIPGAILWAVFNPEKVGAVVNYFNEWMDRFLD